MSLLHAQKEQQQTQEHKHRQRQEEEEDCEEEPLEALIVGAGPAGLIAASYLKEFCSFGPPRSSSSSSADDDGKGGGGGGGQRKGRMVILDETFSPGGIWNREGDHRENVPCFCVDNEDDENDVDDPTRIRTSLNSRSNGDSASSNGRRRKSSSSFAVETSTQPLYENLSTNFPKGKRKRERERKRKKEKSNVERLNQMRKTEKKIWSKNQKKKNVCFLFGFTMCCLSLLFPFSNLESKERDEMKKKKKNNVNGGNKHKTCVCACAYVWGILKSFSVNYCGALSSNSPSPQTSNNHPILPLIHPLILPHLPRSRRSFFVFFVFWYSILNVFFSHSLSLFECPLPL